MIFFAKYNAGGNDFIIIDDRKSVFLSSFASSQESRNYIISLCDRVNGFDPTSSLFGALNFRKGDMGFGRFPANKIGADGLILLSSPKTENILYYMSYFNADGLLSSFCGNGSLCCAHFALYLGLFKHVDFKDETKNSSAVTWEYIPDIGGGSLEINPLSNRPKRVVSGKHFFETKEGVFAFGSRLGIKDFESFDPTYPEKYPNSTSWVKMLDVKEFKIDDTGIFINTGSPHYVIFKNDINITDIDVIHQGRQIRFSDRFKKDGTNVTFVNYNREGISIRTYERGVESETLSCGTGVVAAALCTIILKLSNHKIHDKNGTSINVQTRGGKFQVDCNFDIEKFNNQEDYYTSGFSDICLLGKIEKNCDGYLPVII